MVFDQVKKEKKVKRKNKKEEVKKKREEEGRLPWKREGKKKRVKPQVVSPPTVLF